MQPKAPGLIQTFRAVAVVATPTRRSLLPKTRETYEFWIKRFFRFVERKPASQWEGMDVQRFLWALHRERYAPKSRKQALCALVYVFRHVLKVDIGTLDLPIIPAEKPRIKIIPSRGEVAQILAAMRGQTRLMAGLMYGAGLRVAETCELRVKDVDLESRSIRVHGGKGDKDRMCLLPLALHEALKLQIEWRRALHNNDLAIGAGIVEMPDRMAIKDKSAATSLQWQYLFPSSILRGQRRWHTTPEAVQLALKAAVKAAGILKRVTPHTLRHAYCTHSLRAGNDAATVQRLMGHDSLETTMIYAHADRARGVSPMDAADVVPQLI